MNANKLLKLSGIVFIAALCSTASTPLPEPEKFIQTSKDTLCISNGQPAVVPLHDGRYFVFDENGNPKIYTHIKK